MNMKILFFFFNLLNLTRRTCKTQILRSLRFESRITPNKVNAICPMIGLNCCTNHDIMKMHKLWN